jgi:hypothetical protein
VSWLLPGRTFEQAALSSWLPVHSPAQVREQGGIPVLAALLQAADAGTSAAAVGALQNMTREVASCQVLIAQPGAVEALAALLTAEDVQVRRMGTTRHKAVHGLARLNAALAMHSASQDGLRMAVAPLLPLTCRSPPAQQECY